jgi:hypothetical protein
MAPSWSSDRAPPGRQVRLAHEADTAVAAAHRVQIAFLAEVVHDLHEVVLRDIEALGDVIDRRKLTLIEADLNQDAVQNRYGASGAFFLRSGHSASRYNYRQIGSNLHALLIGRWAVGHVKVDRMGAQRSTSQCAGAVRGRQFPA